VSNAESMVRLSRIKIRSALILATSLVATSTLSLVHGQENAATTEQECTANEQGNNCKAHGVFDVLGTSVDTKFIKDLIFNQDLADKKQ